MALDGIYLRFIKNEIEKECLLSKVEKIYQPTEEEIIIVFRGKTGGRRLLLNSSGSCQRIALSEERPENPYNPPMFCMLLRKHLSGGTLTAVRQNGLDRVIMLDFSVYDELGDQTVITLIAELTGRAGNIILLRENGRIIDAVKRADLGCARSILPGMVYEMLPRMEKGDIEKESSEEIAERVISFPDERLSKSILGSVEGVSPLVASIMAFKITGDSDSQKEGINKSLLINEIEFLKGMLKERRFYIMYDKNNTPANFSFYPFLITPEGHSVKEVSSPSEAVEKFFFEKAKKNRSTHFAAELSKFISSRIERTRRKILAQQKDLAECSKKETFKIMGELITANIYRIKKGDNLLIAENYYENPPSEIEIKLDKRLTPSANAQKYYKEYQRLSKAELVLGDLIEKSLLEEEYLESVMESLSRVESEAEAAAIKEELISGGYLKDKTKKQKKPSAKSFKEETSSDGFQILIGRNNIENDKLTLKVSENYDIWLHAAKIPGSHVIIRGEGREISERAIYEAAVLAARNSKGAQAGKVAVDYTFIKYVKKPTGAKPGKVIYTDYKTIFVSPREE